MIILGFQGTGKTTYVKTHSQAADLDFKGFDTKAPGWEKAYVDALLEAQKDHFYVFGNIAEPVMQELDDRGVMFVAFAPLHGDALTREDEDIKALCLGRYVLRKEQNDRNVKWLEKIKRHYDEWTNWKFFDYPNCTPVAMDMKTNTIETLIAGLESSC